MPPPVFREGCAMAITDYDRQAVIWAGEKADLAGFLDQAEALNGKAQRKATEASHKPIS
jgi:hypothetical protein